VISEETARALWAALETRKAYSLDELQLIAEVEPAEAIPYLDFLVGARFAKLAGVRSAHSGEAVVLFRLIIRQGSKAPLPVEKGTFVDPNVRPEVQRSQRPKSLPSMGGRIRLAAEQIGGEFSRDQLAETMGITSHEKAVFRKNFHHLRHNSVIANVGPDRYLLRPSPVIVSRLRSLFLNNLGRELSAMDIREGLHLERAPIASHVWLALDLLAAGGYPVTTSGTGRTKRRNALYHVDRQRKVPNGCAGAGSRILIW
jgi:hypothetical protein